MSNKPQNEPDAWDRFHAGGPPPAGSIYEKHGIVSDEEMFRQMDKERLTLTPEERADLTETKRLFFASMKERGEDKHWTPELADLPICTAFKELGRRAKAASLGRKPD